MYSQPSGSSLSSPNLNDPEGLSRESFVNLSRQTTLQDNEQHSGVELQTLGHKREESQDNLLRQQYEGLNSPAHPPNHHHHLHLSHMPPTRVIAFRDRFLRKGKPKIGPVQSLKAVMLSSSLNFFLIFVPIAWAVHFVSAHDEHHTQWKTGLTFLLSVFAIMPLARLCEYGGDQMLHYLGKHWGELLVVSVSNVVEATLAIILLASCELKLLQSTLIGIIILNLLLIPGTAFIHGGTTVLEQEIQNLTQLNHSLLTIGVLALLLPAAYFVSSQVSSDPTTPVTDEARGVLLQMSRGLAILLLVVYIGSLVYTYNPPGDDGNAAHAHDDEYLHNSEPEISQWVAIGLLVVTIVLMAITAEFLVASQKFIAEEGHIRKEFFGLILLPLVSFAADGAVAIIYGVRYTIRHYSGKPHPPAKIAKAQAIDLSIQFLLFWTPFIVLLSWMTHKPLLLLFDMFEVVLIVAACFLVNYITADSKSNWAEGLAMVVFYVMIALVAWFYTGKTSIDLLLTCGSVADAVAGGVVEGGGGH